jgi:hypothetical protein
MRTAIFRTVFHASVCVLLLGTCQQSSATTLDFEGLNDGDAVTSQFAGVTLQ